MPNPSAKSVPVFPEFAPVSLEMRDALYPALNMIKDGISEFTFSNLYLFRHTYGYRVSRVPGETFIIEGAKQGMAYPEALILAMKKEKAAFRMYTVLADQTDNAEVKQLMQSLAMEESRHKLRFELEYDDVVFKEN